MSLAPEVIREINRTATFKPMAEGGVVPHVEIGGVEVAVYFDEDTGRLVISLHAEGVRPGLAVQSGGVTAGGVPVELNIDNDVVWQS